ncbi:MAG: response regulator [Acidobacteria bacterium]|nr:response regulator [Acidobacteriota bacterium]
MGNEKKAVLLVDDDDDVIEQIRTVVAQEYEVDTANSGKEALARIAKKKYDCIVMDVMMQTLSDGLDTAKKLKENTATATIPIVMLTSVNESYDYRSQIDESYFPKDKWLDKPVNPKVLLREIRKLTK